MFNLTLSEDNKYKLAEALRVARDTYQEHAKTLRVEPTPVTLALAEQFDTQAKDAEYYRDMIERANVVELRDIEP